MEAIVNKISVRYRETAFKAFKKGGYSIKSITSHVNKKLDCALATYFFPTREISLNGRVFNRYFTETMIIRVLPRVLTHEFFHGLLDLQIDRETSLAFDNKGFTDKLKEYGVFSNREI